MALESSMPRPLAGRSLLAVFAHPDDESLACGGLLAMCAERGAHVSLICLTHGESQSGSPDPTLFVTRGRELTEASRVLGLSEVALCDFPDGRIPWMDPAQVERRIVQEIGRLRPEVVITFGADGLYWHPDHIAVHERTTAVVAAMTHDQPVLFYVTMPRRVMRGIVDEYAAYLDQAPIPLLGIDPDAFGAAAAPPTLIVDVSAYASRKLAAIKCHRTQVSRGALDRIAEHDAARWLGVEHFHRAAVGSSHGSFIEELQEIGR